VTVPPRVSMAGTDGWPPREDAPRVDERELRRTPRKARKRAR
jgi:hypothetical protein